MCVIAIAWNAHPEWPLVVVANRDELHGRPTKALARWSEHHGIIAGRDLQQGGTWLGVSEEGRFAALVNVPGAAAGDGPSRGLLVLKALSGDLLALENARAFSPFNLVCVTPSAFTLTTNSPEPRTRSLSAGVHAVSNAPFEAQSGRAARARQALILCLAHPTINTESLLTTLGPDTADRPFGPGGDCAEPPLFIDNTIYGTRCSTAVLVDRAGRGDIRERSFDANGAVTGESEVEFQWTR